VNVAFIVTLNLDDLSDLPGVAAEVSDDLEHSGFEVTNVQPWARPTLSQGAPIVPTTQPNQQTQTQP